MVPLQATADCQFERPTINHQDAIRPTELLLDDLQNLLLVKLLGETLDSGQSLTTISL